ncbi:MAG: hypothetical protein JKY27_03505 [Magnetovibrio sp.]|nr:hypothetical protein [Magnetovibrio sp.]
MRWSVFFTIQGLVIAGILGVVYVHQDRVVVLKKPPPSIAQWYKPQNKRQVWLHTMFKLRREAQAIEMYAAARDAKNLQTWAAKFNKDYLKIAKMVPEWQARVNVQALQALATSVADLRFADVKPALADLQKSCTACHTDFRAITASMYRAPDFSNLKLADGVALNDHMVALSQQVNQVKIAFVDERTDAALSAYAKLAQGMKRLGSTCASCHENGSQSYPGAKVMEAMAVLEQNLKTGSLQDKGKALGSVAVMACAQCHGTHRLAYDAKQLFSTTKTWDELLKHSF